jgi:hypothetical protein
MYEKINGIPKKVIEVLTPLRKRYDFLHIDNPAAMIYELRSHGHQEVVDFITDQEEYLDRDRFEKVVITIMKELNKDRIN